MMDLEHSGIIEVINPLLDPTPELYCTEQVREMTSMSHEVHMESIQTCPKSLKAYVPQMTNGMHTVVHKQVTFKGTAAPDSRALPEAFGIKRKPVQAKYER